MIIVIEICQDNFIYCKIRTQNLDVKTSKNPKERVKNQKIQCLKIIWKDPSDSPASAGFPCITTATTPFPLWLGKGFLCTSGSF